MALLMTRASAEVAVRESAGEVTITNRHFVAVFSRSRGGLLDSLRTPEGQLLLASPNLYTDYGIYTERGYVGSSCENSPVLTIDRKGGEVVLRAQGTLRPDKPDSVKSWSGLHLSYAVEYRMDDSPVLKVSWAVTPDADKLDAGDAFFAYMVSCPSFTQWVAHTEEGVVIEDDRGCGQRTFQSALDPLHVDSPWIGLLTRKGKVLVFSDLEAAPPFGNIFFHEGGGGTTALFFSWSCGSPGPPLKKGVPWTARFSVAVSGSLEDAQRAIGVEHDAR